jgi:hypothetical protein
VVQPHGPGGCLVATMKTPLGVVLPLILPCDLVMVSYASYGAAQEGSSKHVSLVAPGLSVNAPPERRVQA